MKKYIFLLGSILISPVFSAQSTELFETETAGSASFTDNGQVFNITSQAQGPFDIQNAFPGTGWNGTSADNQYIDNSGTAAAGLPVGFTISSAGAAPFKLNSMYMFFSNGTSLNQSVPGSLTLTGKLGGVIQYTASAASGFVTSTSVNNGFTFINMTTFGGSNNSNTVIDQIVITTGGQYEYVALDAFKWTASIISGAESIEQASLINTVYPNPANSLLNLDLTNFDNEDVSVEISNTIGQVVLSEKVNSQRTSFNIEHLNAGLYIIKITAQGKTNTFRFIKE